MGYPTGQVDSAGLAKVGSNVTHAAEVFDKAFSAQADVLAGGSTLAGWATGAALPATTAAWSTFVGNFAGQIRSFGADLGTTASDYESADSAAADLVVGAGAGRHGRAFE